MPLSRIGWLGITAILIFSALVVVDWSPADASPLGQSVPTLTPTSTRTPDATSTPFPPATSQPTAGSEPVDSTPDSNADTDADAAPVLLPTAGVSVRPGASVIFLGAGLLLLIWGILHSRLGKGK